MNVPCIEGYMLLCCFEMQYYQLCQLIFYPRYDKCYLELKMRPSEVNRLILGLSSNVIGYGCGMHVCNPIICCYI